MADAAVEAAVREMAARHGDNNGALVLLSDWDKSGRLGADKRPGYKSLLDAMEHPDKYPQLTIRVSGYAVNFVRLTREQQLDVVSRSFFHSKI